MRRRKNIQNIIHILFNSFRKNARPEMDPNKENKLWDEWLNAGDRPKELSDLVTLVNADVHPHFKARALIVLLTPRLDEPLPFPYNGRNYREDYLLENKSKIQIENLSHDLLAFVGTLIDHAIDYVRNEEEAWIYTNLTGYNEWILRLLTILPEDDATAIKIFNRYAQPYQSDNSSDYVYHSSFSSCNPFAELLSAEKVPMKWKWEIEHIIRNRIQAETTGQINPPHKIEDTLYFYARSIRLVNLSDSIPYPQELFASQIRFITEFPDIEKRRLMFVDNWDIIRNKIPGDEFRNLRYALARLIILGNSVFSLDTEKNRKTINSILEEFEAEDAVLSTKIKSIVSEYEKEQTEQEAFDEHENRELESILTRMK